MLVSNYGFDSLPLETLREICTSLSPRELCLFATVCKLWREVAGQETFWAKFGQT